MKHIIQERIQAIEVELETLRIHLESAPDNFDISVDDAHSAVTEIVDSVFAYARAINNAHSTFQIGYDPDTQ